MRIGIIGTGSIGGMLAKAWAAAGQAEVFAYNRTPEKARELAGQAPRLHVAASAEDVARFADLIVVCTKAEDGRSLFRQIGDLVAPSQVLATTISTIAITDLESWTRARVAKIIPSITQSLRSGVLLVSYGSRFDGGEQERFESVLAQVATPFAVAESQLRVCSDLTSCGPAFFAAILNTWAEAAANTGEVSRAEAEYLITNTFTSTATLFQSGLTAADVLRKVTVPGGVTEAGLEVLNGRLSDVFGELHQKTREHTCRAPTTEPLPSGREG